MKINCKIVVRKAEPYPGGWSVHYGPDTFTYCETHLATGYSELRAELDRVAARLVSDSRLAGWPGVEVAAELPRGQRRPNGWSNNGENTCVRVKIA